MTLRIAPADDGSWHWQIKYGVDIQGVRPYKLVAKDTAKGHWLINENNGIVLDQFLIAGKLSGVFTVGQSTIINNYWLENDRLVVEFIALSAKTRRL